MASNSIRAVIQGLLAAGACLSAEIAFAATPVADEVHSWNIPAEDGVAAVRDFGLQSGVAISAVQTDLQGKRLNAVTGTLSVEAALRQLTAGTGLKYVYDASGRAITLSAASPSKPLSQTPPAEVRRDPSTTPAGDPPRRPAILLEEIVVTARKREENVQDVPISAEVINGQTISRLNLDSLTQVAETVPSIHINSTGAGGQFFIRGIGSGTNQGFDQSVGTFIDDIYHGRTRIADAAFLDLDRVEVLKGPQGTFFGNNAVAGALNIVTAKPTDVFGGGVRALYGQFGQYAGEGVLNVPAGESFAVRLAAVGDGLTGWMKNPFAGHDQPDQNNKAARVTFLFRPTDNFDALLKVEGSDNHDSDGSQIADCPPPAPFTAAGFCKTAVTAGVPTGFNSHENTTDTGQGRFLSMFEDVLTMHYHIGDQTLTSVSGYYNYNFVQNVDSDGTPQSLLNIQFRERYRQASQELRIASPLGQTLEYLGGVYFQTDRLDGHGGDITDYFLTPAIQANPVGNAALLPYLPLGSTTPATGVYFQDEHSYAAFGSVGWNVTDALKLTAGLRGSWVYKTAGSTAFYGQGTQPYGGLVPLPPAAAAAAAKVPGAGGVLSPPWVTQRHDNAAQPSADIQYKILPDVMLYAAYSRGFLAGIPTGGITSGVARPPVFPEHVNDYEAGIKSKWFDQRLLLNLDIFRSNYTDLQVSSAIFNGGIPIANVTNAGSSRTQGVEFETEWLVSHAFRVRSAITYLDAKYISYPNVTRTALQTFCGTAANRNLPDCLQVYPLAQFPIGKATPTLQDLSGQPTNFAPKLSGSLTASYTIDLPRNYHFVTEADVYASTWYFYANNATDDPELAQPGYARVDGRFSFEGPDQKWAIDILFKNVTDRLIVNGGTGGTTLPTGTGSILAQTEQPRNFAIQARYQW
jgi:iron complex outermembrane recepter protein